MSKTEQNGLSRPTRNENRPGTAVEQARPIFVVFEGGGAKGIAHLGALAAAEQNRLTIIGAAGSSAGALVAAFVAAGFTAHELMKPDRDQNLLARKSVSPIDLFGSRREWIAFLGMRKRAYRLIKVMSAFGAIGGLAAPRTALAFWTAQKRRGHFSTSYVRDFVNTCLREKLLDTYARVGRDGSGAHHPSV